MNKRKKKKLVNKINANLEDIRNKICRGYHVPYKKIFGHKIQDTPDISQEDSLAIDKYYNILYENLYENINENLKKALKKDKMKTSEIYELLKKESFHDDNDFFEIPNDICSDEQITQLKNDNYQIEEIFFYNAFKDIKTNFAWRIYYKK